MGCVLAIDFGAIGGFGRIHKCLHIGFAGGNRVVPAEWIGMLLKMGKF
jgi:hypothetical protein